MGILAKQIREVFPGEFDSWDDDDLEKSIQTQPIAMAKFQDAMKQKSEVGLGTRMMAQLGDAASGVKNSPWLNAPSTSEPAPSTGSPTLDAVRAASGTTVGAVGDTMGIPADVLGRVLDSIQTGGRNIKPVAGERRGLMEAVTGTRLDPNGSPIYQLGRGGAQTRLNEWARTDAPKSLPEAVNRGLRASIGLNVHALDPQSEAGSPTEVQESIAEQNPWMNSFEQAASKPFDLGVAMAGGDPTMLAMGFSGAEAARGANAAKTLEGIKKTEASTAGPLSEIFSAADPRTKAFLKGRVASGKTASAANKAISGYFTPTMAMGAAEQGGQAGEALAEGDLKKALPAIVGSGTDAYFALHSGKHLAEGVGPQGDVVNGAKDVVSKALEAYKSNKPVATEGTPDPNLTGMRVETVGEKPVSAQATSEASSFLPKAGKMAGEVAGYAGGAATGTALTGSPYMGLALGYAIRKRMGAAGERLGAKLARAVSGSKAPVNEGYLPPESGRPGMATDAELFQGRDSLDPANWKQINASPDVGFIVEQLAATQGVDPKSITGAMAGSPEQLLAARAGLDPFAGRPATEFDQAAMEAPLNEGLAATQQADQAPPPSAVETLKQRKAQIAEQKAQAELDLLDKYEQNPGLEKMVKAYAKAYGMDPSEALEPAMKAYETQMAKARQREDLGIADNIANAEAAKGIKWGEPLQAPYSEPPIQLTPEQQSQLMAPDPWQSKTERGGLGGFTPEEQAQLLGMLAPEVRGESPRVVPGAPERNAAEVAAADPFQQTPHTPLADVTKTMKEAGVPEPEVSKGEQRAKDLGIGRNEQDFHPEYDRTVEEWRTGKLTQRKKNKDTGVVEDVPIPQDEAGSKIMRAIARDRAVKAIVAERENAKQNATAGAIAGSGMSTSPQAAMDALVAESQGNAGAIRARLIKRHVDQATFEPLLQDSLKRYREQKGKALVEPKAEQPTGPTGIEGKFAETQSKGLDALDLPALARLRDQLEAAAKTEEHPVDAANLQADIKAVDAVIERKASEPPAPDPPPAPPEAPAPAPTKKSKRVNVKKILADEGQRKDMMSSTIQATQAREGIETTREQAEAAYDKVRAEKTGKKTPKKAPVEAQAAPEATPVAEVAPETAPEAKTAPRTARTPEQVDQIKALVNKRDFAAAAKLARETAPNPDAKDIHGNRIGYVHPDGSMITSIDSDGTPSRVRPSVKKEFVEGGGKQYSLAEDYQKTKEKPELRMPPKVEGPFRAEPATKVMGGIKQALRKAGDTAKSYLVDSDKLPYLPGGFGVEEGNLGKSKLHGPDGESVSVRLRKGKVEMWHLDKGEGENSAAMIQAVREFAEANGADKIIFPSSNKVGVSEGIVTKAAIAMRDRLAARGEGRWLENGQFELNVKEHALSDLVESRRPLVTPTQIIRSLPDNFKKSAYVDETDGSLVIETPGGNIRIIPKDRIEVDPSTLAGEYSPGAIEGVRAGKMVAEGLKTVLDKEAIIEVVRKGSIPHEFGHVFLDHFATPKERAVLQKKYGPIAEAANRGVDEVISDAYREYFNRRQANPQWQPQGVIGKYFKKVSDFFTTALRAVHPDPESIFESMSTGKAFEREASNAGMKAKGYEAYGIEPKASVGPKPLRSSTGSMLERAGNIAQPRSGQKGLLETQKTDLKPRMGKQSPADEPLFNAGSKGEGVVQKNGVVMTRGAVAPAKYSTRTVNETMYAARKANKKVKAFTEKQMQSFEADLRSVAAAVNADPDRLDFVALNGATGIKKNGDPRYPVSEDYTTMCRRRYKLSDTVDAIQKARGKMLEADDILKIRRMLEDKGHEVNCGPCYVESRRIKMDTAINKAIEGYEIKTGKGKGQIAQLTAENAKLALTQEGRNKMFVDDPEQYAVLSAAFAGLNAKVPIGRAEYKGEYLSMKQSQIDKMNRYSGARSNSWSDFEVPHLLDKMQAVMDKALRGLKGQAYTKEIEYVESMKDTNEMINCSVIPEGDGFNPDGSLRFNKRESIRNMKRAYELRDKYDNVGVEAIGISDKHIKALLASKDIDYVIPYHDSGLSREHQLVNRMENWKDYSEEQNWRSAKTGEKVGLDPEKVAFDQFSEQHLPKIDAKTMAAKIAEGTAKGAKNPQAYAESRLLKEAWDKLDAKDRQERIDTAPVEIFIDEWQGDLKKLDALCKQRGVKPPFERMRNWPGYEKLLTDRRIWDKNGKFIKQQKIQFKFDMPYINKMMAEYKGGHDSNQADKNVVRDFMAGNAPEAAPDKSPFSEDTLTQMRKAAAKSLGVAEPDKKTIPLRKAPSQASLSELPKQYGRPVPYSKEWNPRKYTEEQVVANAGRTAMARSGSSSHAKAIGEAIKGKTVFDWGSGKGADLKHYEEAGAANVKGYDPTHSPTKPEGMADIVTNTFVGNVIPPNMRHSMWIEAMGRAKDKMYVAVRAEKNMGGEPIFDGVLMGPPPKDGAKDTRTFQKFYQPGELVDELKALFPGHTVEPGVKTGLSSVSTAVVSRNRPSYPNRPRGAFETQSKYYSRTALGKPKGSGSGPKAK
jgi:hypothetical protein